MFRRPAPIAPDAIGVVSLALFIGGIALVSSGSTAGSDTVGLGAIAIVGSLVLGAWWVPTRLPQVLGAVSHDWSETAVVTVAGKFIRVLFFLACGAVLALFFISDGTLSGLRSTPLGQLTLGDIGGGLVHAVLYLFAGLVGLRWAFATDGARYHVWAMFGLAMAAVIAVSMVVASAP